MLLALLPRCALTQTQTIHAQSIRNDRSIKIVDHPAYPNSPNHSASTPTHSPRRSPRALEAGTNKRRRQAVCLMSPPLLRTCALNSATCRYKVRDDGKLHEHELVAMVRLYAISDNSVLTAIHPPSLFPIMLGSASSLTGFS